MRDFRYIARDIQGKQSEGLLQAAAKEDVLMWLHGQRPHSSQESKSITTPKARRSQKASKRSLASSCWQLSTMLEGGVPITEALDIIRDDMDNAFLQQALTGISTDIKAGESLSGAVGKHPRIFDKVFQAMIMAGETSGSLVNVLKRLADVFRQSDNRLIKKVKHAMTYPLFVFGFVVLILVAMMTFVIPRFKIIFDTLGAGKLPAFTRAYMGIYDAIMMNSVFIVIFVVLLIVAGILYPRTATGHRKISSILLRLPLLGKIISMAFVATFCRTLGTLLTAGVSVLKALDILSGTTKNELISDAVLNVKEQIIQGSSISISMSANKFFPNLVVKMTQVGEESGSLPSVLERVSGYYERKVDMLISTMITLLEPMMIIIVGAIVLVTVLALYLPIFTMSDVK